VERVASKRSAPEYEPGQRRRGHVKTAHRALQIVGALPVGDSAILGIDVLGALQTAWRERKFGRLHDCEAIRNHGGISLESL
jgi:hypothetical protein